MSRKENFRRILRQYRRRWMPTRKEQEERKALTANIIKASYDANWYYNQLKEYKLKKA